MPALRHRSAWALMASSWARRPWKRRCAESARWSRSCVRSGRRSMSDRALFLGADIGTTAAKAGLFDLAGNPLALADSGYVIERPQPDWAEQDPRVWWQAFVDVVDALGAEADLSRVRAVGICSQVNTHVFVDADGADLAPAIVWQDQRAAEDASALTAQLAKNGGAPEEGLDASALVARASWMGGIAAMCGKRRVGSCRRRTTSTAA